MSQRIFPADWTHRDFARIASELQETAGLVFPPNRRASAEAGMRRVLAAACLSEPGELLKAIGQAGETRDALITELTIGETFFLRERGQFEFLRNRVLPELRERTAPRRVRMWSAGCATGEEPYSLAITLREAGWQGGASIVGTDLAAARLVAARRARYTAWSMRGVEDAVITRYFERRGKQFLLRPDVRQSVEFRVLNLASADYPSPLSGIEHMDVILCRNVLIYFNAPTVAAIAARLLASLAPGGWLFLGASDPSIADMVPCEVVLTGAGLAYRAVDGNERRSVVVVPEVETGDAGQWSANQPGDSAAWERPKHEMSHDELHDAATQVEERHVPARESPDHSEQCAAAYEQGNYEAAARLALEAIERGELSEAVWIIRVRSLANAGQLEAAGAACAAALERQPLSPELTHLHGILLAEAGRHADAAGAARRALYLDPGLAVAHLALGDALSRTGETAHARRAFANAAQILETWAPEAPVPGADGAAASQLLGIARYRIGTLPDTPPSRPR